MKSIILLLLMSTQAQAAEVAAAITVVATPAPVIPGNEIMLFDIKQDTVGNLELSAGKNITNQPGYDSQPRFSKDGDTLYYTHAVETTEGSQMDIYQYQLSTGKTKPYMTTTESEYSPTPLQDKNGLSVVQVDAQGDQYIVILDADAEAGKQMKRYSDLKQVGYFNWTSGYKNWSFVLNDAGGGDLFHMGKGKKPFLLSKNIGRTFVNDATNKLIYYVDKNTQPWRIKSRSAASKNAKDIMPLPMGVEDFTLDSKGRFWAGRNNTLFVSTDQQKWFIVAEFNDPNLHQITRLTINPMADKIAIVFAEKTLNE